MEVLYLLVPIALVFIFTAVKILFWAINNGQYDDLDTEAHKILFDEQKNKQVSNNTKPDDNSSGEENEDD